MVGSAAGMRDHNPAKIVISVTDCVMGSPWKRFRAVVGPGSHLCPDYAAGRRLPKLEQRNRADLRATGVESRRRDRVWAAVRNTDCFRFADCVSKCCELGERRVTRFQT